MAKFKKRRKEKRKKALVEDLAKKLKTAREKCNPNNTTFIEVSLREIDYIDGYLKADMLEIEKKEFLNSLSDAKEDGKSI